MPSRSSSMLVQSCCGCFSLQTGSLLIGFSTLILTMSEILQIIFMLIHTELYVEMCAERISKLDFIKHMNKETSSLFSENVSDKENISGLANEDNVNIIKEISPHIFRRGCQKTLLFHAWLYIFVYLIYFILTSVMIFGVKTKRFRLMKPWLMWIGIHIVFAAMLMFWNRLDERANVLFQIVILTYFAIVVNSHYCELQHPREREEAPHAMAVVSLARSPEMEVHISSPHKSSAFNNYNGAPPPYPGIGVPPPSYQVATSSNAGLTAESCFSTSSTPLEGATALPVYPETSTSARGHAPLPVLPEDTFQVVDESRDDVAVVVPRTVERTLSDSSEDDNSSEPRRVVVSNVNQKDSDSPSSDFDEDKPLVSK